MTEDETEAEVQLLEFVRGNDGEEFKLTIEREAVAWLLATTTRAGALEDLVHGGAKDHNRAETKRRKYSTREQQNDSV